MFIDFVTRNFSSLKVELFGCLFRSALFCKVKLINIASGRWTKRSINHSSISYQLCLKEYSLNLVDKLLNSSPHQERRILESIIRDKEQKTCLGRKVSLWRTWYDNKPWMAGSGVDWWEEKGEGLGDEKFVFYSRREFLKCTDNHKWQLLKFLSPTAGNIPNTIQWTNWTNSN